MKVKNPTCVNKVCSKNALNAAKSVIFLIFHLKIQIKGNNSCINKDTSTSNYHNIQCGENEVGEQIMPPSHVRFSNYCTMNHFTVFFLYKSIIK